MADESTSDRRIQVRRSATRQRDAIEIVVEHPPRLLSAVSAAAYLGMSARTFQKHWRSGKLPEPHRLGRRLLWDRELLNLFVDGLSDLPREAPPPERW